MLRFVLTAGAAFVAMEPTTALIHRVVMHGIGERLHRSHHRARTGTFEANDWYPVGFAAVVLVGFWLGFNIDGFAPLLAACVGITAYGAAYSVVHDGYIHRRLPFVRELPERRPVATLDKLAAAHRIHHQRATAPYGMLVPVVPRALRPQTASGVSRRRQNTNSPAVPGPV